MSSLEIWLVILAGMVVTPVAVIMRICGRDPMLRKFDPSAKTYWIKRTPGDGTERYFRQF